MVIAPPLPLLTTEPVIVVSRLLELLSNVGLMFSNAFVCISWYCQTALPVATLHDPQDLIDTHLSVSTSSFEENANFILSTFSGTISHTRTQPPLARLLSLTHSLPSLLFQVLSPVFVMMKLSFLYAPFSFVLIANIVQDLIVLVRKKKAEG